MSTKMADRPARTYITGPVTRALRYVALAGAGALVAYVAFTYEALPDTVPTHFDFTGEADDWGHKSTIWVLLGVNVVMVALLAWLSTRPRWFNYVSDITGDNAQYLYREGERMMVWVNLAVVAVFYGAVLSIYEVDNPFLVIGLVTMPALVITSLIRMSLAGDKKPAQEGGIESTFKNLNW